MKILDSGYLKLTQHLYGKDPQAGCSSKQRRLLDREKVLSFDLVECGSIPIVIVQ